MLINFSESVQKTQAPYLVLAPPSFPHSMALLCLNLQLENVEIVRKKQAKSYSSCIIISSSPFTMVPEDGNGNQRLVKASKFKGY
jgi:hypothetical protein